MTDKPYRRSLEGLRAESGSRKLAPFGRDLFERQKFQNLAFFAVVTAGRDAWPRARRWNSNPNDVCAMVWDGRDPSGYRWPVADYRVIVEWDAGPSPKQITRLIRELIRSGAASVTSRPLFIDPRKPAYLYDESKPLGERWVRVRETIRTFKGANARRVHDAAA